LALRTVAPLVPRTWIVVVPVVAVVPAVTVSVVLTVPFEGGVTDEGTKPQETPDGRLAHDIATADEKPPVEVTVQVVVALAPWVTVTLDGLQATEKSGVGAPATGVTEAQFEALPKQADELPAATTL
jgi:hypothetical protein